MDTYWNDKKAAERYMRCLRDAREAELDRLLQNPNRSRDYSKGNIKQFTVTIIGDTDLILNNLHGYGEHVKSRFYVRSNENGEYKGRIQD